MTNFWLVEMSNGVLIDILSSGAFLATSWFYDVLNLPTRCLIPIGWCFNFQFSAFFALTEGGIFLGLLGVFSTALILIAFLALRLSANFNLSCAQFLGVFYAVDAVLQVLAFCNLISYYKSHTGWMAMMIQLPVFGVTWDRSFTVAIRNFIGRYSMRYFAFTFGVGLMFCSWELANSRQDNYIGVKITSIISKLFLVGSFCSVRMLCALEKICKYVGDLCTVVYQFVTRVWPHIHILLIRVWNFLLYHPCVVWMQRVFIAPLWRVSTPLVTPFATAYIVLFTLSAMRESLSGGLHISVHEIIFLFAHLFCCASAFLSTCILLAHGISRICIFQLDPLKYRGVKLLLETCAMFLSSVQIVSNFIYMRVIQGHFLRILGNIIKFLTTGAHNNPIPAVIMVLLSNFIIIYLVYASDLGIFFTSTSYTLLHAFTSFFTSVISQVSAIQSQSLLRSGDSTLALVVIALSQIMVYALVRNMLRAVQPPLEPERADELNTLAGGMGDPRQCGRCWFGPVDHTGCNSLSSHHGEFRRGGHVISNACPKCGWFVSRLDAWPYWEGRVRNTAGLSVVRVRVWGELVVAVRAASKALIIPFVVLRLTMLPASLSAFLALSYLIPWLFENNRVYSAYEGQIFAPRNQRVYTGMLPVGGHDVDCGARPVVRERRQDPSQAMAQILAAFPARVFLVAEGTCSICLEEFSKDAVTAAQDLQGAEVAARLRELDPPIVALRCGHPLHTECIEQVVRAASNDSRHVRCPLCREPVNLAGAVSARCFS